MSGIRVALRVRPLNSREQGTAHCLVHEEGSSLQYVGRDPPPCAHFSFDRVSAAAAAAAAAASAACLRPRLLLLEPLAFGVVAWPMRLCEAWLPDTCPRCWARPPRKQTPLRQALPPEPERSL